MNNGWTAIALGMILSTLLLSHACSKQEEPELQECQDHLERVHTQLFACHESLEEVRNELEEVFEHYQCEEALLIDLIESKENLVECLEWKQQHYIEQELKVKNNSKKPQPTALPVLPANIL